MLLHNIYRLLIPSACLLALATACSDNDNSDNDPNNIGNDLAYSPVPDINHTIEPFDPDTRATDSYIPGDNNDIYWQANSFKASVDIVYNGNEATVTSSDNNINVDVQGAHVTVEVNADVKTQIHLSGASNVGSLKIYSIAKVLLLLDNVDLKSDIGPAINSQSKKRLFVHATDNSVNRLSDAETYSPDKYYRKGSSILLEDRKGAFFTEDNTIISGNGLITITGNNRHALVTDGSLRVLPGTTLCVESTRKNAIHAKGSSKEFGISVEGGYIYALCTGQAARCLKSDLDINITNAVLSLNNSAEAMFDNDEDSSSSPAAIKSNSNINIRNSELTMTMIGSGAKGINADITANITGSNITVTSTGKRYTHSVDPSSPSGIKAADAINIAGGNITVAMFGEDAKSDAIDCNGSINISDGHIFTYAHGSCIYAGGKLTISGGNIYAFSQSKEAIDAEVAININGGLTLAHSPVALVATEPKLTVGKDASIIAAGGNSLTTATTASTTAMRFSNITLAAGAPLSVTSADSTPMFSMVYLAESKNSPLLIASPDFVAGTSWILTIGGTLSDTSINWNGFSSAIAALSPSTSLPFSM